MKKVISFIFIVLSILIFYTSCNFSEKNKAYSDFEIQNFSKVSFNEQINSFLADFLKEIQEDSCIYELCIDKKNRDEYQLSLLCKPCDNKYFQENHTVNYTIINGKTIFIYSGIEDFINNDTSKINCDYVNHGSQDYIHAWYKIILRDTSYVVKANSNLISPFCTERLNSIIEFAPQLGVDSGLRRSEIEAPASQNKVN